jgi:large subunit ribosomal protein L9
MQVILMEKLANLGNLGDVVKVKDGYARNYLIPQGKAKRATEENLKVFEAKRAELEKAQAAALAQAQERGAKLDGLTLKIAQRAGPDGKLFGSVTNHDIVEALKAQGHEVERANIRMPAGALKEIGEFPLQIALHTDVVVKITVAVTGES